MMQSLGLILEFKTKRLAAHTLACCVLLAAASFSPAGDIQMSTDNETGWRIYTLQIGSTIAKFSPDAGANLFSIQVDGVEYFHTPKSLKDLPGVRYGNPVLYPMPNRVRGAKFTFQGREFSFPPNGRGNFIHGLVNRAKWSVDQISVQPEKVLIDCKLAFSKDSEFYQKFPVLHEVRLEVELTHRAVRWTYHVVNHEKELALPFGFALHPYFIYQGERAQTFLTIPATHLMESEKQLPNGKLISAEQLDYSLNVPTSLEGTTFDDVFFGTTSEKPTKIEFRDKKRTVTIRASNDFTHLVVWTPQQGYFGVESQTCSTDAHNLYSQGLIKEAHLQICEPGQAMSGWVEYRIEQ